MIYGDIHRLPTTSALTRGTPLSKAIIWPLLSGILENGCKLVLFTNRKSHTGFQLIPTSMTLNGVIAFILRFFTEFDSFAELLANYVTLVEERPIYNVRKILSSVAVFYFWPKPTHPAMRSLCESCATC